MKKGLNAFNSGRVISVSLLPGGILKGKIQASMKKNIYEAEVSEQSGLAIGLALAR